MSNVKKCTHITQRNTINFNKGYRCTKNTENNSEFCKKHQYVLKNNKGFKSILKTPSEFKTKSLKSVSFKSSPANKSVLPIRFLKSTILNTSTNHSEWNHSEWNHSECNDPNEFAFFRNSVIKSPQTDPQTFLQKSDQYDDIPIDEDAYIEIVDQSNKVQPINEAYVEESVYDQQRVEQNDLQSLALNGQEHYIIENGAQQIDEDAYVEIVDNSNDQLINEVQENVDNDGNEEDVHKIAKILVELGNF
jgi:hypothetical protein